MAAEEVTEAQLVAPKPIDGRLTLHPYGTVLTGAIWKKIAWERNPNSDKAIAVCWENPRPADQTSRASVRDAVRQSWEGVSWLRFTGWGVCTSNAASEDIRIRIAALGPHTKALGRYLDDREPGMILNFEASAFRPDCARRLDFCIRAVAVHEFGHAIGFAHEQNRLQAPRECRAEREGVDGDWNVTTYDEQSIMNYCNVRWNNDGLLSARDIEAVTSIYGRRA